MGHALQSAHQRAGRQHAAGVHTDCDRSTCAWWTSRPEWQRRGFEATGGQRWVAVKEIGA